MRARKATMPTGIATPATAMALHRYTASRYSFIGVILLHERTVAAREMDSGASALRSSRA
jgi:hypothetical protein